MVVAPSLARTPRRLIVRQRTFAGRWPSLLSRVVSASVRLSSSRTPLSVFVETYGTEQHGLTPTDITNIIKINFDCR